VVPLFSFLSLQQLKNRETADAGRTLGGEDDGAGKLFFKKK